MLTYGFRIRFILSKDKSIEFSKDKTEIQLPSRHKIIFFDNLIIKGSGFKSEEESRSIGEKIKTAILLASAKLRIGIDVGKDKTNFYLGKIVKEKAKESGYCLIEDIHGLCVYPEDMPIKFVSGGVSVNIGTPDSMFIKEMINAFSLINDNFQEKQHLSLELYNLSHFESSLRTQLLILVSAVECLVNRGPKSNDIINYINELIECTKKNYEGSEKDGLVSRLGELKRDSISESCNKLVEDYLGKESMKFLNKCYEIRSKISHEGKIPKEVDLGIDVPELDKLVSQLITKIIENQGDV